MEIPISKQKMSSDEPEQNTGVRYSFADGPVDREDHLTVHPSGVKKRTLEYPTPDPEHLAVRDQLRSAGILLGHYVGSDEGRDAFRVPPSARPIIYDVHSPAQGAFSYGDDQLFYDLGDLLAKSYQSTQGRLITAGVGKNIAFIEFTQPAERRLFLVPGVEQLMDLSEGVIDPLTHYEACLQEELGGKYQDAAVYFRMGFNEAVA